MTDKSDFLYPHRRFNGEFTPENLVFDANLQEFAQKVGFICNLENNGKIPPGQAYEEVKALWKQLKRSKHELGIGLESEGGSPEAEN